MGLLVSSMNSYSGILSLRHLRTFINILKMLFFKLKQVLLLGGEEVDGRYISQWFPKKTTSNKSYCK